MSDHPTPEAKPETTAEQGPPPGVATMAVLRWVLVAAMAVAATLSIVHSYGHVHAEGEAGSHLYYCPMHPQIVQDQPGDCPICGMTLVPKPGSGQPQSAAPSAEPPVDHAGHRHEASDPFACPMHPEETGLDASARCPICKMKLEPRETGMQTAQGVPGLVPVDLALDRVQLIGLRTAQVTRKALKHELKTVGYISADESKLARVHARFSGWVDRLVVGTTGEVVKRGQTLASLYNLELLPAQQEFLATQKWATSATEAGTPSLTADARQRLVLLGMSPAEVDRIAEAGTPSRTVSVVAPISGTVTRKDVSLGAYVQPGTALFEIADLSKVWVIAEVYEHEMSRVAVGQALRFTSPALPDHAFTGKVSFIYPTVDATTRTLRIRAELENKQGLLRPGTYGDVTMQLAPAEGLVIPAEALVDTGEHQYVFLAKDHGRFEPRKVRAGPRIDEQVQVHDGLSEGDVVVTTANFLLDSESRLRATLEDAHTH